MSILASFLLSAALLAPRFDHGIENTNIISFDRENHIIDFNRLRADIDLEMPQNKDFTAKIILDNNSLYNEGRKSLQNKGDIYRAYCEYRGAKHFFVFGRQRVPFGVGRIWNPIDVFNPINSQAIETEERKGTEALRYEYLISDLANFDATLSGNINAARAKGYLEFADLALVTVVDNDNDLDIIGWEVEGELFETGIDLRSEGGSFHDRKTGERHTRLIAGIEYGFANSLVLLGEYLFDDASGADQLGCIISYQPALLWSLQLLSIVNLDDSSTFLAPSLEYSLSDEMTLGSGIFFFHGNESDEFGRQPDQFYLRWFVHF
ncbi:MAG: hypothetical protein KQH63_03175 [Desulfobulbaceae bacterium]|nr:hypothetical protein [Desulfobulbaceae bacterium]